jgi:Carboxypeptidase regulatory-like domain
LVTGATVTLLNLDTGETKDFVTNEYGIYDTVSTRPGNYRLTFTKEGFRKSTIGPVVLQVSVITEDATLAIGHEVVLVESNGVPLLQTETAQLGTIREAETMDKLPQVGAGITGNDWANFNVLLAGAGALRRRRCPRAAAHTTPGMPSRSTVICPIMRTTCRTGAWFSCL